MTARTVSRRTFITSLAGTGVVAATTGIFLGMFSSLGQDPATCDLKPRSTDPLAPDTWSLTGRTQVQPATIGSGINLVFLGQSTNNNAIIGDNFAPEHANNLFNLSIQHRGATFLAQNPLLVSDLTDAHHGLRLADAIVDAGLAENVVITMAAQGGSNVAHWNPAGGVAGGSWMPGTITNGPLAWRIGMAARCIANAGLSHLPTIIDWQQGEWDSDTPGTSQANYQSAMSGVIAECKRVGLLRAGGAMFLHKCTRPLGATTATTTPEKTAVRAAQSAMCDGVLVIEGADVDTLGAEYRDAGGTHFTVAGGAAQAALKLPLYAGFLA